MQSLTRTNALIHETSPYLLQHAHNPVQWYPWNETALRRARDEDKPILLSIGYSACHWCHVMAHESFENEMTAELMNEHFVNIKIDREERPDIDKIYQTAQQLLTRRTGGWPLTMFLTPDDHLPFFGGTYFPPTGRYGLPGFNDLLLRIADYYRKHREQIREQNAAMQDTLQQIAAAAPGDPQAQLGIAPLYTAAEELAGIMDRRHGGFGAAPKFPHPTNFDVLFVAAAMQEPGDTTRQWRDDAAFTLRCMARGGIYDQLGGGFCRYSVDDTWTIPHFEKMLYDNGQLLGNYADAFHVTGEPMFRRIAEETAHWAMRDMQAPDGGYYSSLDADSEGEEGRFYVWTPGELRDVLSKEEYAAFAPRFGIDGGPNFEGLHWHLEHRRSIEEIAAAQSRPAAEVDALIESARRKLLAARNERVWPGRDEKILTSWNALNIKGMAVAALRLGRDDFAESAERALAFVHSMLWKDGRLLATCKDGKAHLNAYIDDHAFLIDAILHLLACRWSTRWLAFAMQLADVLLEQFEDRRHGGFWFTAHDHEPLIQRRKDFIEDALPSGNGIAALALLRLGHLTGESRYLDAAERVLRAAWSGILRIPHAHNSMLLALAEYCSPRRQIVVRGKPEQLHEWRETCRAQLGLRDGMFLIPDDAGALPGLLAERRPGATPVAYVCEGFTCRAPIRNLVELSATLAGS